MANVLGALFQDIADAIRGKTGDTATMKPAEFPDKIAAIETGGVAQATEFIPTTTATNQYLELFGAFAITVFIDEDTYNAWNDNTKPVVVEYDGQKYTCEVQDLNGVAAVGNLTMLGGTGNNEPFAISSGFTTESDGNTAYFLLVGSTVDTAPTEHTVRVYQEASGGGDDVAIKAFASFVTLQGQWGERVTLDFGFIPEFILVFPYNVTYASGQIAYISLSQRFREQYFSEVASTYHSTVGEISGRVRGSGSNSYLDGTSVNSAIYGADDTGFNFGITPGAGSWIVYAIGLPS